MENDKTININLEDPTASRSEKSEFGSESASRARNRTVMLTPEITGQVRARLAQEAEHHAQPAIGIPMPPSSASTGFETPRQTGMGSPVSRRAPEPPAQMAYSQPPHPHAAASAVAAQRPGITWVKETKVVGFLVSYDGNPNGEVFELRVGRMMVTSRAQGETNVLLIDDESVSPMHAIVRIGERGDIQVLDQLSEYGTKIRRAGSSEEEHLSGDKADITHGDVIKFGARSFYVCLVPRDLDAE
ncbi:MAG: FHA domain-containing protein [Bdellovibrionota bacterium]|nr:MAG: FHA domain-containing protein [Bdellovibrionota bacterium]